MQTKLTLRLDSRLIRSGKTFAKQQGQSVSQLVAKYFFLLNNKNGTLVKNDVDTPTTNALRGILRHSKVTKDDYHRHLERKYL